MPSDTPILLIREESPVGTYATPTSADDAFIVFDYNPVPLEAQTLRRAIERGFSGRTPSDLARAMRRDRFSIELCGSGTATTAPKWARLLRGCMFGAAVPGPSDVTIPLISGSDGGALSIAGFFDNARMRGRSARGNAVFSFTEGQLPRTNFDFMSLIQGTSPVDNALPGAVTLPDYPEPDEVNLDNTVVTYDGFTLGVRSFELDLGMKTELFTTTARRSIQFGKAEDGDRRSISARVTFEMPDPALKNYFEDPANRSGKPFSLTHGTRPGNRVSLTSGPTTLMSEPSFTKEAGRIFISAVLEFVPTAANNELTLKTS